MEGYQLLADLLFCTHTLCVCVFCLSVIAVIAATLFPLWPAEMRVGVYYLSVAAGCFVASILLLAVGKYMYLIKKYLTGTSENISYKTSTT